MLLQNEIQISSLDNYAAFCRTLVSPYILPAFYGSRYSLVLNVYNYLMHYDLCLPWYWEYDIDFVQMIERACNEKGLTL